MSAAERSVVRAAVIGGGPAGLIAAETLARAGITVTVYEQMPSVGRKFLLAGRGGLNLTHGEPIDGLLARYVGAPHAIVEAVRAFPPADLRAWCDELGERTFVGSSGRVFPASFRATPLLRAWVRRLGDLGVAIATRHRWLGWSDDLTQLKFRRGDGSELAVATELTVLALGGASWPRTGSDGGWVGVLGSRGVSVTALRAANAGVRVAWTQQFIERFEGTPLKNVAVTMGGVAVRGDPMVTRSGIEGGPIYALTPDVRRTLDSDGAAELTIDLTPDVERSKLADRLTRRRAGDSASTWLRRAAGLSPVAISLLREATRNELPGEPLAMSHLVKAVPIRFTDTMSIDRAISTAGGIELAEIDERFMLRRMAGTFVAGEMLDWEAPTGGYLLQASFSTGVVAAVGALGWWSSRTS